MNLDLVIKSGKAIEHSEAERLASLITKASMASSTEIVTALSPIALGEWVESFPATNVRFYVKGAVDPQRAYRHLSNQGYTLVSSRIENPETKRETLTVN